MLFLQHILEFLYNLTSLLGYANYGIAIILLTIIIKVLLYPLTLKQIKSMKAMQEMQPKMKAIQEKYKGDTPKIQSEVAKLYKDAGVNPLAGCLPLLAQMPILMCMFYALRDIKYTGNPSFMWLENLSSPDPLYILPILSASFTYLQQIQMTKQNADSMQMKYMNYLMPLFIGWISMSFPAGLVLYWATMTIVQILQQAWINKEEAKTAVNHKENKENKKNKKKGKEKKGAN